MLSPSRRAVCGTHDALQAPGSPRDPLGAAERLAGQRYLMGDEITEADWRLLTTLLRFDLVYHTHFKCNRARIVDYPNIWGYTRELYQWPGVAETVHFGHIVRHYHYSHDTINPHRIIPINPSPDFTAPHGRDQRSAA